MALHFLLQWHIFNQDKYMNKKLLKIIITTIFVTLSSNAFAEEVTVTVKGMVCSFCAQGIKKTFSKKENVSGVDVNLEDKIVKLQLKEGKNTTDKEIEDAIKDSGFDVVTIVRAPGV